MGYSFNVLPLALRIKAMYRGIIKFVCNDCGNKFKAPDIEWNATVYSVPQPCPKCGGMHTKPASEL